MECLIHSTLFHKPLARCYLGQHDDMNLELNIGIPYRLAQRVKAYAQQIQTELSQVVIDAIDTFLRGQIKE